MSKVAETTISPGHGASKSIASGLLLATLGAIAFSGKAIIVKLAYRHGVDAVTLIMYRMLFALPIFATMAANTGVGLFQCVHPQAGQRKRALSPPSSNWVIHARPRSP